MIYQPINDYVWVVCDELDQQGRARLRGRGTVVADYALSGAAMVRLRAKLIAKYPEGRETLENIDEVFSADPAQMEQLLHHIEEQYGSVTAYVEGLGAAPALVERLRAALLERTA